MFVRASSLYKFTGAREKMRNHSRARAVLGMEPWALWTAAKHSTTKLWKAPAGV